MTRKKKLIAAGTVLAFLTYSLLTGGLVVSCTSDFGGQSDIYLAPSLESDIYIDPSRTDLGIIFVGHYYSTSAPYAIRLQLWDDTNSYRSIQIDAVEFIYHDGTRESYPLAWSKELNMDMLGSRPGDARRRWLSETIEDLQIQHADVSIKLSGVLFKTDGNSVPFESSQSFQAESQFDTYTFWHVLANI